MPDYSQMAKWLLGNWDAPARAYNAQSPTADFGSGLLGSFLTKAHQAIDPVNGMGGYGGLLSMAMMPGKVPAPELPETWYHGTPSDFGRFRPGIKTSEGDPIETPASFFVNDPTVAEAYASRERQPIRKSLTYGEANQEFYKPALQILDHPEVPKVIINQHGVEDFFAGKWNDSAIRKYLPSSVAEKLFALRNKFNGALIETYTSPGAKIIPTKVSGRFMDTKMFGGSEDQGFNEAKWDFALRNAKKTGLDGVIFRSVVDTPTGKGDPADLLAVFPSGNVRSAISDQQMLGPPPASLSAVLANALQSPLQRPRQ